MGLVTEVDDDAAPTVLIVDNNPMSSMRLSNLFKTRNFSVALCEDGDQAVDEYIRLDPELVVLSLDIPSLDGHLAALEMREHGGEQRIVFVAPSRMAELATNASYSASEKFSQISLDFFINAFVTPLIAEETTITLYFFFLNFFIISATFFMFLIVPTDVPPNLSTTSFMIDFLFN